MTQEVGSKDRAVTVVAVDAFAPIKLFADGILRANGNLEITYPYATADGNVGDPDDYCQIYVEGYRFCDDPPDAPSHPIDYAHTTGALKEFSVVWGAGSGTPGEDVVTSEFFTNARGYSPADRKAIHALAIGATWTGDRLNQTLTRI